jgi:hypothetical protein
MTDVGDGDIAFEPFFAGLDLDDHHYVVERDSAPDPVGVVEALLGRSPSLALFSFRPPPGEFLGAWSVLKPVVIQLCKENS